MWWSHLGGETNQSIFLQSTSHSWLVVLPIASHGFSLCLPWRVMPDVWILVALATYFQSPFTSTVWLMSPHTHLLVTGKSFTLLKEMVLFTNPIVVKSWPQSIHTPRTTVHCRYTLWFNNLCSSRTATFSCPFYQWHSHTQPIYP